MIMLFSLAGGSHGWAQQLPHRVVDPLFPRGETHRSKVRAKRPESSTEFSGRRAGVGYSQAEPGSREVIGSAHGIFGAQAPRFAPVMSAVAGRCVGFHVRPGRACHMELP